jgi:hypothetical protein
LSFSLQEFSSRVFALKRFAPASAFHVGQLNFALLPFFEPLRVFNFSLLRHQLFVEELIGLARTHKFDSLAHCARGAPITALINRVRNARPESESGFPSAQAQPLRH